MGLELLRISNTDNGLVLLEESSEMFGLVLPENKFYKNEWMKEFLDLSPFILDWEMKSSHFLTANQRPGFWREMAGVHSYISDKSQLSVAL